MQRFFTKYALYLIGALALFITIILKAWLVFGGSVSFNSDEAIVALMARHILQGERPIFFYGQAYMGSLDAYLVSAGFTLFGEKVWVIRLVQSTLYLGFLVTTAWLGKMIFQSAKVGVLAILLLSIPTVNVSLYTTASLGGYGEALLVGNLILASAIQISSHENDGFSGIRKWMCLGFLCGFGLWVFGITLVYSVPAVLFLAWQAWKRKIRWGVFASNIAIMLVSGLIGALPWWIYASQNGLQQLLWELSGGAIAGVEGISWLAQVGTHLMSLLVMGTSVTLGIRPPWDVAWLGLPLLPFILMFWLAVLIDGFRRVFRKTSGYPMVWIIAGVMLTTCLGFVLTSFGADPSGRYFLPLAMPLSLFASALILDLIPKFRYYAYGLVVLILIYNYWGTVQSANRYPPGITTQFYAPSRVDHRYDSELIKFLRENGETGGYSNYWVSYPLAFLSGEELIFVPRLPYHPDFRYTDRDDRYRPYDELVQQSNRVAYIVTHNPDLEDYLRQEFSRLDVTWQEAVIGDYRIFFDLSSPVRPWEMELGSTSP